MAIRDRRNGEAPSAFISHVAAVSWAETQQPETRPVIQSPKNVRFLSTSQTDLFSCCLLAMSTTRTILAANSSPLQAVRQAAFAAASGSKLALRRSNAVERLMGVVHVVARVRGY